MKKTLSLLIIALGLLLADACENEPHQEPSYITTLVTYTASALSTGEDPATAHVTLPNFPIRWLARSVSNREICEALEIFDDAWTAVPSPTFLISLQGKKQSNAVYLN